jgi:glycine hydroxymethyltransferase
MQTSGLRLGTAAVTTRGMGPKEMENIVDWMDQIIVSKGDSSVQDRISKEVSDFCSNFPLPH